MTTFSRIYAADGRRPWVELEGDAALLLDAAPWLGGKRTGERVPSAGLRFVCPASPTKILCVGRNYKAHAAELGNELPKEPLWFSKPASSLLDPGEAVLLPPESERVDYEGELALVIGSRCRRVAPAEALAHVFGYAVACDVTARDLQKKDGQWTRAKGFDTFCPLGPHVVTDVDPRALSLTLTVNAELKQDGNTRDMAFDVAALVAHASSFMTLEPGDLILTGTPEGVGPLSSGDRVLVRIGSVGELGFDVKAEAR